MAWLPFVAAVAVGCGSAPPAVEVRVLCPEAVPSGLRARVFAPAEDRLRYGATSPVLVRLAGLSADGWDIGIPAGPALAEGATVVQILRPREGERQLPGPTAVGAARCVTDWVAGLRTTTGGDSFQALAPPLGPVVVTGLSLGASHALIALADTEGSVDGLVLWEPPITDQLILSELNPGGQVDPTFVPGTCTLAGGCQLVGRVERLAWSEELGALYHDLDGNGLLSLTEPAYRPTVEILDNGAEVHHFSRDLIADAELAWHEGLIEQVPAAWPSHDDSVRYWGARDATDALLAWGAIPAMIVATRSDHVQPHHEHVRLAQEGFAASPAWWRLNPDSAYVEAMGGAPIPDLPARVPVDDPVALELVLPELPYTDIVLAAEMEMADRARYGRWVDDLQATLLPAELLD